MDQFLVMPAVSFKPKHLNSGHHPSYETSEAACFDLPADLDEPITCAPGALLRIPTGVYLSKDEGKQVALMAGTTRLVLRIYSRSGMSVKDWSVEAGVVDSDYANEIQVLLRNCSSEELTIVPGQRVAQAAWTLSLTAVGVPTKEVIRAGGFSSTGA